MTTGSRNIAIAAVLLVAAAALGYWTYGTYQQRDLGKEVMKLAEATGRHMDEALSTDPSQPSEESVQSLDGFAAAADRNLEALKRVDAARSRALADAADDFLLTSREILRRQAAAAKARRRFNDNAQALRDHLRADNRTGAWVKEAVDRKDRLEKNYRDYQIAAEALDKLLASYPASLSKLASLSRQPAPVAQKLVAEAQQRATAALQQATGEIERFRQAAARR